MEVWSDMRREMYTHTTAPQVAAWPSPSLSNVSPPTHAVVRGRAPPRGRARGSPPNRVGIHRRLEGAGVPQTGSESTGAWRGSSRIACSARVPLDRVRSHEFMHARYAVKCPSQLYPYKDHSTLHFLMTSAF
jgi:hypothetical protein